MKMLKLSAMAFLLTSGLFVHSEPVMLASGGRTGYVIVAPVNPEPAEATAIAELKSFLKQITGCEFPVVNDPVASGAPAILVGAGPASTVIDRKVIDKLNNDGIILQTVGNRLVLTGRTPRGTLYAVYSFLENVIGCEFWSDQESDVPVCPELSLPDLKFAYNPPFQWRSAYYGGTMEHPRFAARMRNNGTCFQLIPAEFGDREMILGFCHTFFNIIPPSTHFAKHPEWFSEVNGVRVADGQLCLTNPELRKEMVRSTLVWLRSHRESKIVSVSQNDNQKYCHCANCTQLENEEGSPSGPIIHLVNLVAGEVAKEFPGVQVATLAYEYSRQPPRKVKPASNVIIHLCAVECDSAVTITDPGSVVNHKFSKDVRQWSRIAGKLFIWNYYANFQDSFLVRPNIKNIGNDLRFYNNNHVMGIFAQGYDAQTGVTDFTVLRTWLLSHLLWNPRLEQNVLVQHFLSGYYGAAAPYLKEYLDLTHTAAARQHCVFPGFSLDHGDVSFMTAETAKKARNLFAQAESAAANNPILLHRVLMERLALDYTVLYAYKEALIGGNPEGYFDKPEQARQLGESILKTAVELGVSTNYRLGYKRQLDSEITRTIKEISKPVSIPAMVAGIPHRQWSDVQPMSVICATVNSSLVDDPLAAGGQTICIKAADGWTFQYYPSPFLTGGVKGKAWQGFVIARAEAESGKGDAFIVGLYNTQTKQDTVLRKIQLEEIAGTQYRVCPISTINLTPGSLIYIASTGNKAVKKIFIERLLFVDKSCRIANPPVSK